MKAHQGVGADAGLWAGGVSREYRKLLMAGAVEKASESVGRDGKVATKPTRKGVFKQEAQNTPGPGTGIFHWARCCAAGFDI